MPIHPGMVEDLSAGVRDLYVDAEQRLLGIVARQRADGFEAPAWAINRLRGIQALRRGAQGVVDALGSAAQLDVFDVVAEAYSTGPAPDWPSSAHSMTTIGVASPTRRPTLVPLIASLRKRSFRRGDDRPLPSTGAPSRFHIGVQGSAWPEDAVGLRLPNRDSDTGVVAGRRVSAQGLASQDISRKDIAQHLVRPQGLQSRNASRRLLNAYWTSRPWDRFSLTSPPVAPGEVLVGTSVADRAKHQQREVVTRQ